MAQLLVSCSFRTFYRTECFKSTYSSFHFISKQHILPRSTTRLTNSGTVYAHDRENGDPLHSLACNSTLCPCRLENGSSTDFRLDDSNRIILLNSDLSFSTWTPKDTVCSALYHIIVYPCCSENVDNSPTIPHGSCLSEQELFVTCVDSGTPPLRSEPAKFSVLVSNGSLLSIFEFQRHIH